MLPLPDSVRDVRHLEELLSEPSPQAIDTLRQIPGDLLILGVGGKMGPTLARMALRASQAAGSKRRIIAVSRFGSSDVLRGQLDSAGLETIACDVLDAGQLAKLPDCPNVISMFGMKFGSTGQEALTWGLNCLAPGMVCARFAKSRIVLFSTGNVYSMRPVALGGSVETDGLAANGEYAASCIGRERLAEYQCGRFGIPLAILRLNYALEMRYGVLVDVAQRVWREEPIDVCMGYLNTIWQGDANAQAICALAYASQPPCILNIAGPETLSVRRVALQFGELLQKPVRIEGSEGLEALLSNGQKAQRLFGSPRVGIAVMMAWIADWIRRGGATHGKPTHFEVRDGKY